MKRAFVLVNTEIGWAEKALEQLKNLPGVKEAHRVHGVYDHVVVLEAEKTEDLNDIVDKGIRRIEGILYTLTIPTIRGFAGQE